jgi:hypothetical protein
MAQAGSHRPLTAEARVRARVSPYGIRDGQSFTMTGIFPSSVFSRVSTIPPWLFILVYHLGHKIEPFVTVVQRHIFIPST